MLKLIKSLFRKTPKKPEENAEVAPRVVPQEKKTEVAPTPRRQPVTKAPAQLNSVSVPIERAPRPYPYPYGGTQSRESSSDDGVTAFNVLTASLIVENLSRYNSDISAPSPAPAPAYDSYSCSSSSSYSDSGSSSSCDSSSYSDSSSSGSSSWD